MQSTNNFSNDVGVSLKKIHYAIIIKWRFFNYYFPATLSSNAFEVGDTVTLNARGETLTVDGPEGKQEFDSLPSSLLVTAPGDYTVTQTDMTGAPVVEQFFVHIPASESNIFRVQNALPALYTNDTQEEGIADLLIWFASAALVCLVVEWFLHMRENV